MWVDLIVSEILSLLAQNCDFEEGPFKLLSYIILMVNFENDSPVKFKLFRN